MVSQAEASGFDRGPAELDDGKGRADALMPVVVAGAAGQRRRIRYPPQMLQRCLFALVVTCASLVGCDGAAAEGEGEGGEGEGEGEAVWRAQADFFVEPW